ncbi:transcription factor GTE11-like [Musa acuminata AAA Group]|uniref:transcription factor GTE11-like n=1 Tax=Musa acuminata AAA Group TaxID=214697 RepID=UPI0031E1EDC1
MKKISKISQDRSSKAKGKPPRSAQGHGSGSIPDCQHDSKKMVETEGSGSAIRANSSGNSSSPKRKKCVDVNVDRCNGFNAPLEVISLSKKSGSKRKTPTMRLRSEPEHIEMLREKLPSKSVTTVGISTSSSIHGSEKIREQNIGPDMKGGLSGKSVPSKTAPMSDTYLALMKQCETLLKKLLAHHFAWVFDHPVDAVKLNIPDYHTIIKRPMDLGTIKSKLTSGAYSSPCGFASDVRLTFKNAMTYNPPSDDVHIMAVTLSKFFESRWKFIEKKLAAADAHIEKETQSNKAELSKKRKMPPPDYNSPVPERKKSKMMDEENQSLNRCLESLLADLSDHIIDFLSWQSGNMNQSIEEIKTHIDSFCDDTLFKLRTLLDNYIKEREVQQPVKTERVNDTGVCTSQMRPCKGNDLDDEDVDICDGDLPVPSYPPLELQKDLGAATTEYSSSSGSSSDSDSDSSSGSDSEDEVSIPKSAAEENSGNKACSDHEKSDIIKPFDVNSEFLICLTFNLRGKKSNILVPRSALDGLYWCYWQNVGPLSGLTPSEMDVDSKPLSVDSDGCQEGEHASSERKVSSEKLYRAACLMSRFADTILKAQKSLDQADRVDPEKLQREREEIERQRREERARLQAEAKAAEGARRRAEAEAAVEAKHRREREREAAHQALLQMEKTVEIDDYHLVLKDLEILTRTPMSFDEKCPGHSLDDVEDFRFGGSNPMEQLGLFLKVYDEEDEVDDIRRDRKSSSSS